MSGISCPNCDTTMDIGEGYDDQADCELHVCPECEYEEEVWL